jgi:hypothetical protein
MDVGAVKQRERRGFFSYRAVDVMQVVVEGGWDGRGREGWPGRSLRLCRSQ